MQTGFGWRGKLAHKKAHWNLHKNTKRIRRQDSSFRRVTEQTPIEKMPWRQEGEHHA